MCHIFCIGSTLSEIDASLMEDSFSLDLHEHTKFSIWVSFCEIYNENIHDLLEPLPTGAARRPALRLSQDVKGNLFVKGSRACLNCKMNKDTHTSFMWPQMLIVCLFVCLFLFGLVDLRWVQVNNADEAYKVMKLGKKHQSFSSTKLNQLSSRRFVVLYFNAVKVILYQFSWYKAVGCYLKPASTDIWMLLWYDISIIMIFEFASGLLRAVDLKCWWWFDVLFVSIQP